MNRCTFGEHAPCNACGCFFATTEPHVHALGRTQRRVLCGNCYDAIIIAARHTLLAVKSGGFRYNAADELRGLLDAGAVVSYAQAPLGDAAAAAVGQAGPESK